MQKIAIIDFDVHHGNGTQEIIKNLSKNKFQEETENKFGRTITTKTVCTPWLDYNDPENVLFVSIHGYDAEDPSCFYPSSGKVEDNTPKDNAICISK